MDGSGNASHARSTRKASATVPTPLYPASPQRQPFRLIETPQEASLPPTPHIPTRTSTMVVSHPNRRSPSQSPNTDTPPQLGKVAHYAFDAVLGRRPTNQNTQQLCNLLADPDPSPVSAFLAGVRRSTGLTYVCLQSRAARSTALHAPHPPAREHLSPPPPLSIHPAPRNAQSMATKLTG